MRGRELEPAAVPYLDRLVGAPAVFAHAFALAGLVASWQVYRVPWAAAGLFAVSAAMPVALVAVPRRHEGRLPGRAAAGVVTGVLAVSAAMSLLLPPSERASLASWNWSTGAMTMLGVAAYVSTARTLVYAAGHAVLGVVVLLASEGGVWGVHLVLVSTLVPPVGAAEYLRSYADGLRRRAAVVADRLEAETERQALDDVRLAGGRRLGALREEMQPLLEFVADGGALPLDDERSRHAQQLADRLREALVAQRRALWLPPELGDAPVSVVCSDTVARATGASERAWLAALLDVLDAVGGWEAVRVVLDARPDGSIGALVTARGSCAQDAAHDPRVHALGDEMGALVEADGSFLSIDADLRPRIGA